MNHSLAGGFYCLPAGDMTMQNINLVPPSGIGANPCRHRARLAPLAAAVLGCLDPGLALASTVTGRVIDADTKQPLPARIYVQSESGQWLFPRPAVPDGIAVTYQKQNWLNRNAEEHHTCLSPHPFRLELAPGQYTFTIERGKEYRVMTKSVRVQETDLTLDLPLSRWVNMEQRGWFSGDTHVHRTMADLPTIMLAEDLNVALPLTAWVTRGGVPPTQGDKTHPAHLESDLVKVDATHVIDPRNTEYEIFSMGDKRHTLGALFVLHHQTPLTMGVPPLIPVVQQARREGALLDLDKHNWPWSMTLIPLAKPDLFELANNHHWRTTYSLTNFGVPAPKWMEIGSGTQDERHWTLYGFQTYYTLLNCGFRLHPSAGSANGVHPVPLGFGRVYVFLPEGFSFQAWIEGLRAGRSFVTTGPMLLVEFQGLPPGSQFPWPGESGSTFAVTGRILSEHPVGSVEIIRNGQVTRRFPLEPNRTASGAWESPFDARLAVEESGWLAVRCWEERPGGRCRFAHTAPVFLNVPKAPLKPKIQEVQWLVQRAEEELERSADVLSPHALEEYRLAVEAFKALMP